MILRLASPAARRLLVFLALVFAVALSYSGIRNTLAVYDAGLNSPAAYERATKLEPDDARDWYLLGRYWQYNLDEPDSRRAIRAYQKALSFDSHSADTWLDLATAYESEGDVAAARNAFVQATRMYSLSPDVSWRYGNFLIRRGEFNPAFAQIKHAVESDPKRGAAAFALAMRFEPDVNTALEHVLPHTKEAYLSVISSLSDERKTDEALIVWSRLAALHPQLQMSDSYPLLEALFRRWQMKEAQTVWSQALEFSGVSRSVDPPGSLVWDGGFEVDVPRGGFSWSYVPFIEGVQINLDKKEKHSGDRSLRLTFNGLRNVNLNDLCQYVAVKPSTSYLFSAWVQTRDISTDQGVRFSLQSLSPSTNAFVWTDDVKGTQPWTQVKLPWTAGEDVRELRLCIVRVASTQFDSKIRGSAWIDDVSMVPQQSAENTKR